MWAIIYLISNVFLKTEKSDSITAHYKQQFKSTMLFTTELHKCIKLKLVKQINPIGLMKIFTKPDCNICTE